MTYRIVDESGMALAEIKFNSRIHDDLVAVYLQDVVELLDGAGYQPITEEEE
jgi:hypothetical protein